MDRPTVEKESERELHSEASGLDSTSTRHQLDSTGVEVLWRSSYDPSCVHLFFSRFSKLRTGDGLVSLFFVLLHWSSSFIAACCCCFDPLLLYIVGICVCIACLFMSALLCALVCRGVRVGGWVGVQCNACNLGYFFSIPCEYSSSIPPSWTFVSFFFFTPHMSVPFFSTWPESDLSTCKEIGFHSMVNEREEIYKQKDEWIISLNVYVNMRLLLRWDFLLMKELLSCIHPACHALAFASLMVVFTVSPASLFTPYCESIFFWSRALFVVDVVTVSCLLDPVLCSLGPGWLEITCFLPSVLFVLPSLLFLSVLSLICLFVKNVWVKFNARSLLFSPVPLSLPPLCLLFCCLFCVCVQVWTRRQTKGVRGEGVFF